MNRANKAQLGHILAHHFLSISLNIILRRTVGPFGYPD